MRSLCVSSVFTEDVNDAHRAGANRLQNKQTTTILHFTLERMGTQVSGFRWTSFGLGLSPKARIGAQTWED